LRAFFRIAHGQPKMTDLTKCEWRFTRFHNIRSHERDELVFAKQHDLRCHRL
jgi:hypothetical protein